MINRLAEFLIRENPLICKALRMTYPVVFLDEFQDITYPQFDLLLTAFDRCKTIFTAVGDEKQRIMVWAGAMPDAFTRFESEFDAQRIPLVSNWRSHEDLVRIQHVIASKIDSAAQEPQARAKRLINGDVAAIWEFKDEGEESDYLARWIKTEVEAGNIKPDDVAILVRQRADDVENKLSQAFQKNGLKLRNASRNLGEIAIQDLLGEDLTRMLLRLLRLGAVKKSPENWDAALQDLGFLEAVDSDDEAGQRRLQQRLQKFVRVLRRKLSERLKPLPCNAKEAACMVLNFIGAQVLRRAFPPYQRQADFDRVWQGFVELLKKCLMHAKTWSDALDEFEGRGQTALMTIHKSKGLEFHIMILYGLDKQRWPSLKDNNTEDLKSFFVAFTRAKQRAFFTVCTERGQPVDWIEDLLSSAGVRRVSCPYL